jgi:hypothetical protein
MDSREVESFKSDKGAGKEEPRKYGDGKAQAWEKNL